MLGGRIAACNHTDSLLRARQANYALTDLAALPLTIGEAYWVAGQQPGTTGRGKLTLLC